MQADAGAHVRAPARRPFAWKGSIYVSQWLALPPGQQERAALGRLDLEAGSVELVYRSDALLITPPSLSDHKSGCRGPAVQVRCIDYRPPSLSGPEHGGRAACVQSNCISCHPVSPCSHTSCHPISP